MRSAPSAADHRRKAGRIEANELAEFYWSLAARGPVTKEAISNLGGPLKLLRPVAAAEGLRIVERTNGQHAIEVIEPTVGPAAPPASLRAVEGEILAIVDDRGGQIEFGELAEAYRKVHGKAIDYRALGFERLRLLVEHLPGIDFDTRFTSNLQLAVLRRAVAGDQPTTRDCLIDALARWIGRRKDGRVRSDTADLWLTQHRARFGVDLVPEGLDWLTVGLLAPHGLRKRRAKDFFWIETTAAPAPSRSAETPAPAAAMSAPTPATTPALAPAAPAATEEPTDPLALFMTRVRAYVDCAGALLGNDARVTGSSPDAAQEAYRAMCGAIRPALRGASQQQAPMGRTTVDGEHVAREGANGKQWKRPASRRWLRSSRRSRAWSGRTRAAASLDWRRRRRREAFPISPRQAGRLSRSCPRCATPRECARSRPSSPGARTGHSTAASSRGSTVPHSGKAAGSRRRRSWRKPSTSTW